MTAVTVGLERLLDSAPSNLVGPRLGLLTNPSGIDQQLRSGVDLLRNQDGLELAALYGPEHGVWGEAQAGDHVAGGVDERTGLQVFSLYGATHTPTPEMLEPIDILMIDMQDIGVRYTTYLSTVAHVMDACAAIGTPVVILDRPNPIGLSAPAGNILDPAFASFVGIHAMPIVHGLTIGEFGRLRARDRGIATPTVIPMVGWTRDMWFDETGLPWVFPSPNLPTLDSVIAYPATCLIEGTTLSEGRGTTRPFEIVGAPWIVPELLVDALHERVQEHVRFRPLYFTPTFSKHAGVRCGGIELHVRDRNAFDSVALGPHLLATIRELYPDDFAWLPPRDGAYFIDKLAGGSALRETIDTGASVPRLLRDWDADAAAFNRTRSDILLYDSRLVGEEGNHDRRIPRGGQGS